MSKMIITDQCESCKHGTIDDRNKARIKVMCSKKEKMYYFGQCIPCDDHEKKTEINYN